MIRSAVICAGLAVLLTASQAGADPGSATGAELLEQAREAHYEVDYARAQELVDQSLRAGDHDRTSLSELYGLSGRLAAAFGRPDDAYDDYRRMLSLRPGATLPAGLAPKIVAPYDRARGELAETQGITLRVARATGTTLTVAVSSDPLGMVAEAEAIFGGPGGERARAAIDGDLLLIVIPSGARGRVRIAALDRYGNQVAELDWTRPAPSAAPARPRPDDRVDSVALSAEEAPPARARPVHARWELWGGAAVAAAATAVYFGLRATSDWNRLDQIIDDSVSYDFEAARRLEQSGRRNQIYTNIGAAAALGLAGVSLYLRLRDDGGERSGLDAGVGPDGAAISWSGRF